MARVSYEKGHRFWNLVVVKEVAPYISPTGHKSRKFLFKCDCGSFTEAKLASVKYGAPKSCGCLQRQSVGHNLKKHGEYQTRLYSCWQNMKARAKSRDGCNVFVLWDTFPPFKEWAMANGYADDLVLCRNGDTGNYQPDNVRWDTRANNNREAIALKGSNLFKN